MEITSYISEALIKAYPSLELRCEHCDASIKNIGTAFSTYTYEFATSKVLNDILKAMGRKAKIINLKLAIDQCIKKTNPNYQNLLQLLIKNPHISVYNINEELKISPRTIARHINNAYEQLARYLKRDYGKLVEDFIKTNKWILSDIEMNERKRQRRNPQLQM